MTYHYDRKIERLLIISMVATGLVFAGLLFDTLFCGWGTLGVGHFFFPAIFLITFVIYMVQYNRLPNMEPARECKIFGIWELALHVFLLAALVILTLGVPYSAENSSGNPWVFWTMVSLIGINIFIHIIAIARISGRMRKGNDGLLPVFNHEVIALTIATILLGYYLFGIWKTASVAGIDATDITDPATAEAIFYILVRDVLVNAIYNIAIFLLTFYVALMSLVSGLEDSTLGFFRTFKATLSAANKYNVFFWVSFVASIILLILGISSCINLGMIYFPLVLLQVLSITIRVPTYFWAKHINKTAKGPQDNFHRRHFIILYAGILVGAYAIASSFFGWIFTTNANTTKSAFLTYGIFVPLAIIRSFLGIRNIINAYRLGDPVMKMRAYVDFLFTIVTVTNVLFYLGNWFRNDRPLEELEIWVKWFYVLGLIFSIVGILYTLFTGVILLVNAIRGLKGKRAKTYARFEKAYDIILEAPVSPPPVNKETKKEAKT